MENLQLIKDMSLMDVEGLSPIVDVYNIKPRNVFHIDMDPCFEVEGLEPTVIIE